MNLAIGSDHAGFELKETLIPYLKNNGHSVVDKGTYSSDSTDYPDFAHAVAKDVQNGEAALGIVICGSANGVAMTANKHVGIRCAVAWLKEIASLARQHNDANVLAIPARYVSVELAKEMVEAFLSESFEGGRHNRRVEKISSV